MKDVDNATLQAAIDQINDRLDRWYWRFWYTLFPVHIKVRGGVYREAVVPPHPAFLLHFEGCTFYDGIEEAES